MKLLQKENRRTNTFRKVTWEGHMERSPGMVTGVDNGLGPKTIQNTSIMQEKQIGGIPEKALPHSYPT
jgi:hypothetical protein